MIDIYMTFREDSLNGFHVMKRTRFCDRQTERQTNRQTPGEEPIGGVDIIIKGAKAIIKKSGRFNSHVRVIHGFKCVANYVKRMGVYLVHLVLYIHLDRGRNSVLKKLGYCFFSVKNIN